jgi:hypothetical protein
LLLLLQLLAWLRGLKGPEPLPLLLLLWCICCCQCLSVTANISTIGSSSSSCCWRGRHVTLLPTKRPKPLQADVNTLW